jgi:hypothetical protein
MSRVFQVTGEDIGIGFEVDRSFDDGRSNRAVVAHAIFSSATGVARSRLLF